MRGSGLLRRGGMIGISAALAVGGFLAAGAWGPAGAGRRGLAESQAAAGWRWAEVGRADLDGRLVMTGELISLEQTEIECKVKSIHLGRPPSGMFGRPCATTILSVLPDGSLVKKGDVVCRLDAADFEEQARQQKIAVESARAELTRAELTLGIALTDLQAFQKGEHSRKLKEDEATIALGRSELARARDRRAWARRMVALGYVSALERTEAELAVQRAENTLSVAIGANATYVKYTAPKMAEEFQAAVDKAQADHEFAMLQEEQATNRLETLEEQVTNCAIAAPHDGMLIYFDFYFGGEYRICQGAEVFQHQTLFILPNLAKMGVAVDLPEALIGRVKAGMAADVKLELLPDRDFAGKLDKIAMMPVEDWKSFNGSYVFPLMVKLDSTAGIIRPGGDAEVRLKTGDRRGVVVVPLEALRYEEGEPYCLVLGPGGAERRAVTLGMFDRGRAEVTRGLVEGDRVAVGPAPAAT